MLTKTTVLFSTQGEALELRKRLAQGQGDALLGMNVTTPQAFLEELWDVWGSGERLIASSQRKMLIKMLLDDQDSWVASAGTVDLLAPFVRDFITYLDDDFVTVNQSEFSETDKQIISFIRRYEDVLAQAGLIEGAQALQYIALSVKLSTVVVRTQRLLPAYFRSFLDKTAETLQIAPAQIYENPEEHPEGLTEEQDKRYLLLAPSGKTVTASLIFNELTQQKVGMKSVVTAPDPSLLFDLMKHALLERDTLVSLETTRAFGETYFGRIYHAISILYDPHAQLVRDRVLEATSLYLESPYANISKERAQALLAEFKGDRTLTSVEICAKLREASQSFEYLEELLMESDAEVLFDYFESMVIRMSLPDSEKECEFAAIKRARSIYQDGRNFGMPPFIYADLIEAITVPYSCLLVPNQPEESKSCLATTCTLNSITSIPVPSQEGKSWVEFTTIERAASYPVGCCDMVVLTSLDSDHYSGALKHSTVSEFIERFGLPYKDDTFAFTEACFLQSCSLARSQVVLEYPRHNASGEELYPAFFLESFLSDCEERGISVVVGSEQGEDEFANAARLTSLPKTAVQSQPSVVRGLLDESVIKMLFSFERDSEGVARPVISPSAIESYLKCPYCWFAERKLHLYEAEEAFGPREIGNFAHHVFQVFYNEWASFGKRRVCAEDIEEAEALLANIFDRACAQELEKEPGDRLVAQNELEQMKIVKLKEQMLQSLLFQHELFANYQIYDHEIPIDRDDRILYAGAIIQGRIDRIDEDEHGNFIVVDYKGSIYDHEAGFDPEESNDQFELPEKVQALIYAQAWKRKMPGMRPKGAVYLSYKAKKRNELLSGSLSETFVESSSCMKKKSVVKGDFERYLNLVEDRLSETVERMISGDIAPNPYSANACKYCPVLYCEKRINGSK